MGNVTYRATENMSKKFGHLVHLKNLHYFSEIYTKPLHVDKIVCRMKVKIEDLNLTIECHTCNCKKKMLQELSLSILVPHITKSV